MRFLSYLFPIYMLLKLVHPAGLPSDDFDEVQLPIHKVNEIEVLTHHNCSNITKDEMGVILSFYPYVKVKCQAETSVLVPTALEIPKNPDEDCENNQEEQKGKFFGAWKQLKFNEYVLVSESNYTRHKIPLAPCFRTSGLGRGVYEFTFSLIGLIGAFGQVSRALPFYTTSGSIKLTSDSSWELNYNLLCAYEKHQVRPVVEISTLVTREHVREWTVDVAKRKISDQSDWRILERVLVMEDTILLSCISEKYVENICAWNNEEVISDLTIKAVRAEPGFEDS